MPRLFRLNFLVFATLLLVCGLTVLVLERSTCLAEQVKPEKYILATGVARGPAKAFGERLAALSTKSGLPLTTIPSSGSVESVELLAAHKAHFALIQDNVANDAYYGRLKFASDAQSNLRGVAALWPDVLHCLATEKSRIQTWADLAGKRLATGELGSGSERTVQEVLSLYGLNLLGPKKAPRIVRGNIVRTFSSLLRGGTDAAAFVLGAPNDVVRETLAKGQLRFVQIDSNMVASLRKVQPSYVPYTIKAGLYGDKQPEPVETIATDIALICSRDVDPHDVFRLLTIVFENELAFERDFAFFRGVSLSGAVQGLTVPLHPGALHYYKYNNTPLPERLR